jgi:hypothetical protein
MANDAGKLTPPRRQTSKEGKLDTTAVDGQISDILRFCKHVGDLPIVNGQLLEDIDLTSAASVKVQHKLGRKYRGFIVVKTDAGVVPYVDSEAKPETEISIACASDCTVTLWVF